jgi:hypothetical protein
MTRFRKVGSFSSGWVRLRSRCLYHVTLDLAFQEAMSPKVVRRKNIVNDNYIKKVPYGVAYDIVQVTIAI